jgi:hypothetical protein
VDPDEVNGPAIVRLLVSEGDDVGVIVGAPGSKEKWRALGAYVAVGSSDDPDLIERAAQHARSIVLVDALPEIVEAAIEGARLAGEPHARIIYCSTGSPSGIRDVLQASGLEYVLLHLPVVRKGIRRRPTPQVEAEVVAEAVNAADDVAGEAYIEVDPATPEGRKALALGGERPSQ